MRMVVAGPGALLSDDRPRLGRLIRADGEPQEAVHAWACRGTRFWLVGRFEKVEPFSVGLQRVYCEVGA